MNAAGKSNGFYFDVISGDITAPSGTIKINGNDQYTKSTAVTLELSAWDNAGGSGLSQMRFSNNNSTWSTPETYAVTKSYTLTTGDGTKKVYAKFKDIAGNWSGAVYDTIKLDTIAPHKLVINTVTSPTNKQSQTIKGTKATAAYYVTVACPGATIGTVTCPTSTTWSCALTNLRSGSNAISVKARDLAGNETVPATATILVDMVAPVIVITSPADGTTMSSPNLTVKYTADGIAKTSQVTLSAGQNTVTVTETDAAGNVGSASITVTYATAVTLPSIVTTDGYRIMVQKRKTDNTLAPAAPYIVKGVNWSPASKDTTGPEVSETAMRSEFSKWCDIDIPLINNMNANTIRTFQDFGLAGDIYAKDWKYILDKCYANGLMVIVTVDRCIADTNRITQIVNTYKNHPAVLMWLIGNEWTINNFYGAYGNIDAAISAAEDAASLIKTLDANHPVATSVGDLNHPTFDAMKDIVRTRCPPVDVWGFNLYRGKNFANLFDQWRDVSLGHTEKPLLITEFGCDDYNVDRNQEDQDGQRTYEYYQWADIAKNLSADDPAKTAAGGCVFEFNDEWWKVKWTVEIHNPEGWYTNNCPDGHASEEWWGLVDIDRNPRLSYQLFKEYFGGIVPEPPAAETAEDYNVVRFSTQPDTVTTNLETYMIADVFKDASEVIIDGENVMLDFYNGFSKDVVLSLGANTFVLDVTFNDSTTRTYHKTVIYDPGYSTAVKNLVYANNIVVDLDAGAILGKLPVTVNAVTHDGKFFIGNDANVYSTATNQSTGTTLNLTSPWPLFSPDDKTVYTRNRALDFDTNSILTDSLPISVDTNYCSTDSSGYLYSAYIYDFTKVHPVTFAVIESVTDNKNAFYKSCISKDGTIVVGNTQKYANGTIYVMDAATLATTTINALSDWMGNIIPSDNDAKMFVGAYGNSYYGKGGVYVIDKGTKAISSYYHQFGAQCITVSPDSIFATSIVVDHSKVDSSWPAGTLVQGSIYHRGIEVLKLNEQSVLEYQKSFFLRLSHQYILPVKLFYKKSY